MLVQVLVAIADGVFIGWLGIDALAGIALVVPFVALMFNVANGGMGGGVASSLSRALGGDRLDDARAIVLHAFIIAAFFALAFVLFDWFAARRIFQLLGGSGAALDQAVIFSHVMFNGAIAIWLAAFSSALLRGSGNAVTPAKRGLFASIIYVPLSGLLMIGAGDWPGFGLAGSAIASIVVASGTAYLNTRTIFAGRLGFIPDFKQIRLRWMIFRDILRVGLLGSATTLLATLTATLTIGLVSHFGVAALAGYGIGVRLEYMLAPIAFGIGSGLTTLVGVAVGAKAWQRAMTITWIGGAIASGSIGVIGWAAAFWPEPWAKMFASDPDVIGITASYIRYVAPFYFLFGFVTSINFASQGSGRMVAPVAAGFARLVVTIGVGWFIVEHTEFGLKGVFVSIAVGMFASAIVIFCSLLASPWRDAEQNMRSIKPAN